MKKRNARQWWDLVVWHWHMMPYTWRLPVAIWKGDGGEDSQIVAEIEEAHRHRP